MAAPQRELEIRVPAEQSEGTRSQVLRWLKSVGDRVGENEPVIELETDKVTVEIASPGSGVLAEILKREQDEVAPGELLGRIAPSAPEHLPPTGARPAAPSATGARAKAAPSAAAVQPAPSVPPGQARPTAPAGATPLSPAVRRLLAEHGFDPLALRGTGEGGRLTVADVMAEVAQRPRPDTDAARSAASHAAAAAQAAEGAATAATLPSHRVPHSAIRKRIARHMVESLLHAAPHVTTVFEVDMGAVLADRQRQLEAPGASAVALTLTAYFARAAIEAIRAVPEANSRWMEDALEIFDTVNLGIATAAATGLVVPVLPGAESLGLLETARRISDLVERAREGKLTPAEVRGGTFTISNHGVSGSLIAAPIVIHQPQSAILGVGKLEKRAVVKEEGGAERIVARPRCYATLTIDHRVMDGSQANRFMQVFCGALSEWGR